MYNFKAFAAMLERKKKCEGDLENIMEEIGLTT